MKAIIGLGNPGCDYAFTRHNIGFLAVDGLAAKFGGSFKYSNRLECEYCNLTIESKKTLIVKPLTYMNNSGRSVRKVMDYFDIPPGDLLVIADDIYLKFGILRLRAGGGAGGHNGLKSVIEYLGTNEFKRLRIGVDAPPDNIPMESFVLSQFTAIQRKILPELLQTAIDAMVCVIENGFNSAMNKFNKKNT